jgi:hypothetical protein
MEVKYGKTNYTCACIAVMTTVFTISTTFAPLLRSFTGLFSPCSTGPIATAFELLCTALYVLFPVFRSKTLHFVISLLIIL